MLRIFLFIYLVGLFLACKKEEPKNSNTNSEISYKNPLIPENPNFAGETLPMNRQYVREALDFELIKNNYWHSNTMLILKRKSKYFPIIEKILEENAMPDDFKYLAVAESNLDPIIVSPAKAKGFWQFLKGTAIENGLEVNEFVDERSNLEKSTKAAIQYLKELKDSTGSWSLAAASYNAGLGNVRKAMKAQDFNPKKHTYFDLKLFRETERYIYRIVAYKSILENPEVYGFQIQDVYTFPEFDTLVVNQTIPNLHEWAELKKSNYKSLIHYNPWILSNSLPVENGKSYQILIPKNEQ